MSYFAKVSNNRVINVIRSDEEFFNTFVDNVPGKWVQTSYNTHGGVHTLGGTPFRKNYAGIGYSYDRIRDAFIPPKPFESWILNEDTCLWDTPTPMPDDGQRYTWNEEISNWDLIEVE
jgi:hypothetical protein